jgi:choline-sulfatase
VLLIMSDEHRRDAMGTMGHPVVRTVNLDRLAKGGCCFTAAYCNSPLCGPSRSSFVTGRFVFETGCWDQRNHYAGSPDSWGDYLISQGIKVVTIGKLDFREGVEGGFPDQRLAQHRKVAGNTPPESTAVKLANTSEAAEAGTQLPFGVKQLQQAGSGDYWIDRVKRETEQAIRFLSEEAPQQEAPWVLWLNYLPPHFPLIAPPVYFDMYPPEQVDMPYDAPSRDHHRVTEELRRHFRMGKPDEATVRQAKAAYYGLCSYVDDQVGQVLQVLEESGLTEDTLIIYTSDHGDQLGDHDMWWKSSMYEQSVGVPLLMSGYGIPELRIDNPVSLLDVTATIADAVGLPPRDSWRGTSLLPLCRGEASCEWDKRTVFAEYHAHGTAHSMYMIRKDRYKYIYHPQQLPQLFDLQADPKELVNMAMDLDQAPLLQELHEELLRIVDPDKIDAYVRMYCKLPYQE